MIRFKPGDIVKEDGQWGIILQAGPVAFDIVWVGGMTCRYRYATGRDVRIPSASDLDGQEITLKHLRDEAERARDERRRGARIRRGAVHPSR